MAANGNIVIVMGENVNGTLHADGKLHIIVDLTHRGGRSASGKSITVASTKGNHPIPGTDVVLGINAYTRA